MVQLTTIFKGLLALSTVTNAGLLPKFEITPSIIATQIDSLTSKTQAIQASVNSLSVQNVALLAVGSGPLADVIKGFADIARTSAATSTDLKNMATVAAGTSSDAIYNSFCQFVVVNQQLLTSFTSKAALCKQVSVATAPLTAGLAQIEGAVDTLASTLISKVPSRAADFKASVASFDKSIITAVQAYNPVAVAKSPVSVGKLFSA